MPYHGSLSDAFTVEGKRGLLVRGAAAIGLFVLVDALVIHPFIWHNQPTFFYFAVKPLWVGIGLILGALWLVNRGVSRRTGLLVGGVIGILYLQLYYTVFPIPIVGGEAIQVGLVGNLTEGLIVHLGGFALALAAVQLVAPEVMD